MTSTVDPQSERILILAPIGRDARTAAFLLEQSGLETRICADFKELAQELEQGAGAAIITEEAFFRSPYQTLPVLV
jgi:hypothetical protein